jgi:hypothetical protein
MSTSSNKLNVIIIDKTGSLKSLSVKDFKEDELFKKCGFKNGNNFGKQTEWVVKIETIKYYVSVYAKTDGKANTENKYDFPPPIDTKLFFGSCVVVGMILNNENKMEYISLNIELWEKMYEKLFGGFESLDVVAIEDENEEDELDNIAEEFKTKDGYLKDGFVVDDNSVNGSSYETDEDDDDEDEDVTEDTTNDLDDVIDGDIEDIGSELSEDEYSIF